MSVIIDNRICDLDTEALEQIRRMVHRLSPSWQNPERFYEAKSEISGALTTLLRVAARQPSALISRSARLQRGAEVVPQRKTEAHFMLSLTPPEPPPERILGPVRRLTVAKLTVTRIRPECQHSRRHRYPRPPRNLKTQGELLP